MLKIEVIKFEAMDVITASTPVAPPAGDVEPEYNGPCYCATNGPSAGVYEYNPAYHITASGQLCGNAKHTCGFGE